VVQKGAANAGLWDQRLLIDFVTNYIGNFGGRPDEISLWGESAGAGSILFQLTSSPPISNIKSALLQSPAYLWQWNPGKDGYAAEIYKNLTTVCKCNTARDPFKCLQQLPVARLQACNKRIINIAVEDTGLIPFNPAIDEVFIKDLPTVVFQKGMYNNNKTCSDVFSNELTGNFAPLTSLFVSHVADESKSFVPEHMTTTGEFEQFLANFMPGDKYVQQRASINKQYPESSFPGKKGPFNRAHAVIQDSSFTCNTRFIFDAYHKTKPSPPTYMMHYGFFETYGLAVHASDLMPTFWNQDISYDTFFNYINDTINPGISNVEAFLAYHEFGSLAPTYQSYLASFATVGYPTAAGNDTPYWYPAKPNDDGDQLKNVMDVGWGSKTDFNNAFVDIQNSKKICSFWRNMTSWVELAAGIKTADQATFRAQKVDQNIEL
jgi:carboxylesterase type B